MKFHEQPQLFCKYRDRSQANERYGRNYLPLLFFADKLLNKIFHARSNLLCIIPSQIKSLAFAEPTRKLRGIHVPYHWYNFLAIEGCCA